MLNTHMTHLYVFVGVKLCLGTVIIDIDNSIVSKNSQIIPIQLILNVHLTNIKIKISNTMF